MQYDATVSGEWRAFPIRREMLLPNLEDLRYLGEDQHMDCMRLLH